MGEFILALLVTGVAWLTQGRRVFREEPVRVRAAYAVVTLLGLAFVLAASLGLGDRVLDAAAGRIGEVLPR